MIEENKRVLLGMSGGTDSSVAAMRLLEAGYEVIGVTFRFYELNGSTEYLEDARNLAERLGIRHITYAADSDKDQTFFLWGLKQDILNRMLLPMGDITKAEARSWAAEHGFRKVATKKDSIGVCFCPMDYRTFLKDWLVRNGQMSVSNSEASINNSQTSGSDKQAWSDRIRRGRFVDEKGTFIAWHEGYPFYTIGQRRGLGIHLNRPVFVKEIDPEKNEVVLASLSSLEKTEMWLKDWNLVNQERTLDRSDIIVKIRYRKQENHGTITVTSDHLLHVQLHEPLTAIAPGQAAAFYGDGLLLGGGIIVNAR